MSRRKGKSDHRVRDWDRRFVGGLRVEDETSSRQKLTQRKVKLPAGRLLAPEENPDALPKGEGMVVGLFPGGVLVRMDEGRNLLCSVAKTFRAPELATPLAVGDRVTVALARTTGEQTRGDMDRADGMVLSRKPRKSALCRPQITSGKRHDEFDHETIDKVIVANMDTMIIVASTVQPALRPGPVDRFLIVAERGDLAPVLAVNKIDLAAPNEEMLQGFRDRGMRIVLCSAVTGAGLEELRGVLAGRQSVLAGASGAGKSTLINALVPGAGAVTRTIRAKDDRGRHTTSAASVYELPGGGLIVDTPGIREIGIHLSAEELPWFFPEFEAFLPACKFRNCTHTHEPACAVQAAVDAGAIPAQRYDSYLRILASLEE
jgi:ribosome biogenesis GTPase